MIVKVFMPFVLILPGIAENGEDKWSMPDKSEILKG